MIADQIARLGLTDVTVVGNDTGGALAQLLLDAAPRGHRELVLTPCDALEVFPPALFKPLFVARALPAALAAFLRRCAFPRARRLPIAFGWLTKRATDETDRGLGRAGAGQRRDPARRRALPPPRRPGAAARRRAEAALPSRARSIIAWPPEDRCFPVGWAAAWRRSSATPRFVEVEDSYSFVPSTSDRAATGRFAP